MGSVTIAELLSWEPGDLGDVADQLNKSRKTLVDLQDEIDATKPPADWHSDAGNAARSAHRTLKLDLNDMTAEVAKVVLGLDVASTNLARAKTDLQGQLDHARTLKCTVDHGSGQVTPPSEEDDPDGEVTQAQVNAVAQGISEALTDAANADADLAGVLKAAQKDQIDGGKGSLADANALTVALAGTGAKEEYYKQTLGKMSAAEQKQWIKDHAKKLPPEAAAAVKKEVQEDLAREMAQDIHNGGVLGDRSVKVMAFLSHQQPFAHQFYSEVSPEEIAKQVRAYNDDTYPNGYQSDHADDGDEQAYRDFLSAAGATLATYTKGTGTYAPPGDLTDRYFDAITADEDGQGAALTLLLRAGGAHDSYEPRFLSDLTGKVYDWERDQNGPVWGPRDDELTVNPFGTDDDHYRYATDGLANLLGAMEKSPDAAQKFFYEGYPDHDLGAENDRLKYLVTERTFSSDKFSDEGDGLGKALEAAAVGDRDDEPLFGADGVSKRDFSADFTSDLFKTIADKSGTGDGHLGPIDYPDDKWHIWSGMGDELGNIGAGYSSDVYDIVAGNPHPGPGHLDLGGDDFDKVLGEIGRGDKKGIETLSAGLMIEGNHRLDGAIAQYQTEHPGQPVTMEALSSGGLAEALRGVGGTNGEVVGHVLDKSVLVDIDDDKIQETRDAYVAKAVDVAGGFVPGAGTVLGEGASEISKSAYDLGKSEGLDLLKDQLSGSDSATSDTYVQGQRSSLDDGLKYNTINQLIRNGYFGDQHPGVPGGDHTSPIPESLLVDGGNGQRVLNPGLYDADGVDSIGKEGQYTPAEVAQMKKDWYDFNQSTELNQAQGVASASQDGFDRELNQSTNGG